VQNGSGESAAEVGNVSVTHEPDGIVGRMVDAFAPDMKSN
jgi:hypothetical protein